MGLKESLLFIPDISGFTSFVNKTEIQHSEHIISELLEVLIDSNILKMTVSEIEGDAVLFYKNGQVPSVPDIIEQARHMYVRFHTHLRHYDSRRICNCGACCTAVQLKLKMVVHSGDIGFINVKNTKKPHGREVILIHRLLKNTVEEQEYVLMSEAFSARADAGLLSKLQVREGSSDYDDLGKLNYSYFLLDLYKNDIKDPPPLVKKFKINKPLRHEGFINRQIKDVFEILTNLDLRLTWMQGIDKLEYKKNRVNRIGMKHTCVINGRNIEFETVTNDFGGDRMVYGEQIAIFPVVKEFTVYNIMEEEDNGTRLSLEAHYKPLPVIGWIFVPLFKKIFRKNLQKTFESLKEASEESDT